MPVTLVFLVEIMRVCHAYSLYHKPATWRHASPNDKKKMSRQPNFTDCRDIFTYFCITYSRTSFPARGSILSTF